jgi:hypothetical protein
MAKYDEVEVIQRAYDELKCLDPAGVNRALDWLRDRFTSDHENARKEREAAARTRIAARAAQGE